MLQVNRAVLHFDGVARTHRAVRSSHAAVSLAMQTSGADERFVELLSSMDFSTDHLLQDLMGDQTVNPLLLAVEGMLIDQWGDRYFDGENLDGDDIAHMSRTRRFSMRDMAQSPGRRLATQFLMGNVNLSNACWEAFTQLPHNQGRIPFPNQFTEGLSTVELIEVLHKPSVREALTAIHNVIASLDRPETFEESRHEIEASKLAAVYRSLTGEPLV